MAIVKTTKTLKLFDSVGVMTAREAQARYEVLNETFVKKLQIEARVLGDMITNHVIPTAFSFQNTLITNVKGIKELFPAEYETMCSTQLSLIHKISGYVNRLHTLVEEMVDARRVANKIEDIPSMAEAYNATVFPYMAKIREIADKLEMYIDDELWPLPKYRELMFFR